MGSTAFRWGRDRRVAVVGVFAGLLIAGIFAFLSTGTYHDDDLTHLQMARWSWIWPHYLLDDWGRPGFTVLYAVPALLGPLPARLLSALLTALTAWLCYDIARRQRSPAAALAPWLLWAQPLTLTLSYTWLTETTFALYLALALNLHLRRQYALSCAVISLAMITRHEGALLVGIWGLSMLWQRRSWRVWIWLAWAPVVHNLLSLAAFGRAPFIDRFLNPTPTDEYGAAGWLWMLGQWPIAAGLGVLLLAVSGVHRTARLRQTGLMLTCGVAFFLMQTVLYRYGLFASGGYARFFVSIGPIVAIVAANGCSALLDLLRRRNHALVTTLWPMATLATLIWIAALLESPDSTPHRQTLLLAQAALAAAFIGAALAAHVRSCRPAAASAVFTLAVLLAIAQHGVGAMWQRPFNWSSPLELGPAQRSMRDAVAWLRTQGLSDRPTLSANNWFNEFTGQPVSPFELRTCFEIEHLPVGGLFLWESKYAPTNYHGLPRAALRDDPAFRELQTGGNDGVDPLTWAIYERITPPTTAPSRRGPA